MNREEKSILYFCSRCHRRFQEFGEVLEWGKSYPEFIVKRGGKTEVIPANREIKKALCKRCMVKVNSENFDRENPPQKKKNKLLK